MDEDGRAGVLLLEESCECGTSVLCVAGLVVAGDEIAPGSVLDSEEAVEALGSDGLAQVAAFAGVTPGELNRCPACGGPIDRLAMADAVEELRTEVPDLVAVSALVLTADGEQVARALAGRYG